MSRRRVRDARQLRRGVHRLQLVYGARRRAASRLPPRLDVLLSRRRVQERDRASSASIRTHVARQIRQDGDGPRLADPPTAVVSLRRAPMVFRRTSRDVRLLLHTHEDWAQDVVGVTRRLVPHRLHRHAGDVVRAPRGGPRTLPVVRRASVVVVVVAVFRGGL